MRRKSIRLVLLVILAVTSLSFLIESRDCLSKDQSKESSGLSRRQ